MARYNTVAAVGSTTAGGTIVTPNEGLFTTLTGTAPYTVTLTSPATSSGATQGFWNNTGGLVTLATPSGAIRGPSVNSASTYVLINTGVIFLTSDGTNYIVTGIVGATFTNVDVTTTYTASAAQQLWINTGGGAFTISLPASPQKGDTVRFIDVANTFDTNNLTVNRNGQPIMGAADNLTVSTEGAAFDLIYYNATFGWRIFTI